MTDSELQEQFRRLPASVATTWYAMTLSTNQMAHSVRIAFGEELDGRIHLHRAEVLPLSAAIDLRNWLNATFPPDQVSAPPNPRKN